jgi:hypothetical protein
MAVKGAHCRPCLGLDPGSQTGRGSPGDACPRRQGGAYCPPAEHRPQSLALTETTASTHCGPLPHPRRCLELAGSEWRLLSSLLVVFGPPAFGALDGEAKHSPQTLARPKRHGPLRAIDALNRASTTRPGSPSLRQSGQVFNGRRLVRLRPATAHAIQKHDERRCANHPDASDHPVHPQHRPGRSCR